MPTSQLSSISEYREDSFKTIHNINIVEYLKAKTEIFRMGFLNAVYGSGYELPAYNRIEYICGYGDGTMYKDEVDGAAYSTLLRKVGD